MAIWMAQVVSDYEGPLDQYLFASEEEAQEKAYQLYDHWGLDPGGPTIFIVGPIGFGVELADAPRRPLENARKAEGTFHSAGKIEEGFDRFMRGVVECEEKKRAKKTLNEDSPARRYIKKYGELPQNRIVIKR
jgi:hypothetical protein